jgi:hypothetical protein
MAQASSLRAALAGRDTRPDFRPRVAVASTFLSERLML